MLSSIVCGRGGTPHYNEWMSRASNSAAAHNHSVRVSTCTEAGADCSFPGSSVSQIWSILACDISAKNWRLIGTLAARGENWLQEEFFSARRNQIFQKISGDSEFLIPLNTSLGTGVYLHGGDELIH